MKTSPTSRRLLKLTRDYSTLCCRPTQPKDIFASETKNAAAKHIQCFLSLMVPRRVLKTQRENSKGEGVAGPQGTAPCVRYSDSVSTGKRDTRSYLERLRSGTNSPAPGSSDLTQPGLTASTSGCTYLTGVGPSPWKRARVYVCLYVQCSCNVTHVHCLKC